MRGRGEALHLFAALALMLVLLVADAQRMAPAAAMRTAVYSLFEPVFMVIAWPGKLWDELSDSLRFGSQLRADNERLRQQNLMLSANVQKLSYLASDNARLRGLMQAAQRLESKVLVAEVIGIDPDPSRHVLLINQGARDGLYLGQPVLDARGVLGRVVQLGQHTARLMLVSDRQHSVPVRINRNGMRAILSGTGDAADLRLQYVPVKSDIKRGDLLVTSGLGQDFPAGYPVGRVTEIRHRGGEQFLEISASPIAALDRSRYVLALFERPQAFAPATVDQPLRMGPGDEAAPADALPATGAAPAAQTSAGVMPAQAATATPATTPAAASAAATPATVAAPAHAVPTPAATTTASAAIRPASAQAPAVRAAPSAQPAARAPNLPAAKPPVAPAVPETRHVPSP